MRFTHIVSLGGACAPAWQIRNFTQTEAAFPFDWLVLPFRSLIEILRNDFEGFIDLNNFDLAVGGESVLNIRYPLLYPHDFPQHAGANDWKAHKPQVHSKYRYLIDRWRATLQDPEARLLFVRQQGHFETVTFGATDTLSSAEIDELCELLSGTRKGHPWELLLINATHALPSPIWQKHVHAREVSWDASLDWPNPDERWRGNTREWRQTLTDIAF